MTPQTAEAIRQIQALTHQKDPSQALVIFMEKCSSDVCTSWVHFVEFQCIIHWGHFLNPETRFFNVKEIEKILGTTEIVSFLRGVASKFDTDRTICLVLEHLDSGRIDTLYIGAIAAIILQFGYVHTIDPKAQDASKSCMGMIFGTLLCDELERDHIDRYKSD